MRDSGINLRGGPRLGLLILGACTAWLVVQNVLLFAAATLWVDASTVRALAVAFFKAGALLISAFWSSPAAFLMVGLVLAIAVRALPAASRREVNHV